jgi:hypothetical protein
MKLIGLSLGGCLRSIISGEVSEDDVMFIVTRTNCPDFDKYIKVVEHYHSQGNLYARNSERYELSAFPLEQVTDLAIRLYQQGKIHQPRAFTDNHSNYTHPVGYGDGLWMEVVPSNSNTTPAVVAAYNHYKMLDSLTNR